MILILLLVIGIASLVGLFFVWRSEAHLALREGKNVWAALHMIGVEYYGLGNDIYDESTESGLKEDENEDRQWQVYRANTMFAMDGSKLKDFG